MVPFFGMVARGIACGERTAAAHCTAAAPPRLLHICQDTKGHGPKTVVMRLTLVIWEPIYLP